MLPSDQRRFGATSPPPPFSTGYCEVTTDGLPGDCGTDDKGSFGAVSSSGWAGAFEQCARRCLGCARCRFVSLSVRWRDCSWFHDCDALLDDIPGFRTYSVRSAAAPPPPQYLAQPQQLASNLPALVEEHRCWVPGCGRPRLQTASTLVVTPSYKKPPDHKQSDYGHLWEALEAFFQCVVQERLRSLQTNPGAPELSVLLPTSSSTPARRFSLFRELQLLFSGPAARLHISRQAWVPVCSEQEHERRPQPPPRGSRHADCCLNRSALRLLDGGHDPSSSAAVALRVHSAPWLWRPRQTLESFYKSLRRTAWLNLGVVDAPVDSVIFVSNEGASNGRRILQERSVAAAVRRVFAIEAPTLRWHHTRLEALSYRHEIRLIRRARVFISLFGSALHNCRFLPDDALILELHGALRNDHSSSDWYLYRQLCQGAMPLRWAGYAVPGAGDIGNANYSDASIDPEHLARFVRRAWRAHRLSTDPRPNRSRDESATERLRRESERARARARIWAALDEEYREGMRESLATTRRALRRGAHLEIGSGHAQPSSSR